MAQRSRLTGLVPEPIDLPAELADLRKEVREFISQELDAGSWTPRIDAWHTAWDGEFSKRLGQRGWLGMTVPVELGGHGLSALARYVVTEELLAAGAPVAAHWISDRQVAPSLVRFGTDHQQQVFLPLLVAGEIFFGIGMSEPDAGSDLASIRTRATATEGGWIISGTKVWTTGAHLAGAMIVLARTSARDESNRHAGMSQFIVDTSAPGVTISPIRLLSGEHHFNEVVFDNVFVPDDMVLGEIGNGWHQVTSELAFERSGPERFLSTFPLYSELLTSGSDEPFEPGQLREVGALFAQLWTLRQMSLGVAGALDSGAAPNVAAAIVKDIGTRFEGEVIEAAQRVIDKEPNRQGDPYERQLAEAVLHAPGFTLRGGTNEILRGIIAKEVGLR
ncbi:acyl-CoA dehydrogenase family protein [Rhodococcoides yunnanense]|uniref:acyl-CoA dehydrogenase family protein n=1 Tax=Rhodococcoides yunnanense TaxID=278209 RepID=UPI000A00455A